MHIVECAGGVDVYLRMLLSHFDHSKYEQILVCSKKFNRDDYISLVDSMIQINMQNNICIDDIKIVLEVRSIIKQYTPDLIYCHSSKAGGYGRIANIGLGYKLIYNPHGWSFNMKCTFLKRFIFESIEKFLSRLTTQFIAISDYEKKTALCKKICSPQDIIVIYNGIDFVKINKDIEGDNIINRNYLKIPSDAFVIGMVGRISSQKSPDVFIKAAVIIKKKIPKAHFVIVGDGCMRHEIELFAREKCIIDSLTITGWVEKPSLYIKLFDVACLLSRWEGFGLVLAEYMALKKIIIATNVDAIPELIQNDFNGILIAMDNTSEFVDAVFKLYHNPNLCAKYVQNGYKFVNDKFSISRVVIEHEKVIQNIMG